MAMKETGNTKKKPSTLYKNNSKDATKTSLTLTGLYPTQAQRFKVFFFKSLKKTQLVEESSG